ncbi:hypothetical protein [Nocardia arthritidis]|uniref:Uncharacterized protein n=1 Tax=Nocardia arthritidis TaxID=228602 RepID=A0A6G9YEX1_9NOCA|nr:hypothetical protein [Nocardia arthritidis]QIS11835.1 hypothetical protein F5544_19835 [Nocardia arthritidis]
MVNDAEKRWRDPRSARRAMRYGIVVLVCAGIVFGATVGWAAQRPQCLSQRMLCDGPAQTAVVFGPAVVLLLGGIGAFVQTYLAWRRREGWPIWQGAGWFLFTLMLVYLGIGGGALASD